MPGRARRVSVVIASRKRGPSPTRASAIQKAEDDKSRASGEALTRDLGRMQEERTRKAGEEAKKRQKLEEDSAKAVAQRRSDMGKAIGGAGFRGVSNVAGGAMRIGGAALGLAGGFAVADAARSYMSADAASIGLANAMYNPGDAEQQAWLKKNRPDGRFDKKALMDFAASTAVSTGVDKTALMKGWADYTDKSSDWKAFATDEGKGTMVALSKLATASGTDIGELMSAAGSLRVQNPDLTPDKMNDMMRGIVGQGKMGAVTMPDLATNASTITSGAGKYVGKGGYATQAEAQSALLGLSQIAVRTAKGAPEAATAVKDFGQDLGGKADKAEKNFAGLHLKGEKGQLLKVSDMVENIFKVTEGDTSKMGEGKGHIGMGRESIKIMDALKTQYAGGYGAAKAKGLSDTEANKAGAKAAGDEVRKFEKAGYNQSDIDRDFKEVTQGAGKKIEMAATRIREAMEVKMAPVVERLADKFIANEKGVTAFVDAIGKAAEFLIDNPWKGIGLIVAASISKEIAVAGLGAAMKNAMEIPAVQKFGTALGIASVAAIALAAGMAAIDDTFDKKRKQQTDDALAGGATQEAQSTLLAKVRSGKATDADLATARNQLTEGRAQLDGQRARLDPENKGFIEKLAAGGASLFGGDDAIQAEEAAKVANFKRQADSLDALQRAIEASTKAMLGHAAAAGSADPSHPARNGPQGGAPRGGTSR